VLQVGQPLSLDVTFHEDVVVDENDISLRRLGGEVYDVAVAYDSATHTATITTPQGLKAGRYELIVSDTIVDANGLALDGELTAPLKSAALPSGDGVPGGEAVLAFAVTGARGPARRIQPSGQHEIEHLRSVFVQ
jgi:hypothetical protein